MYKLFVGIDVAKGSSVGHGLDGTGETLFSLAFPMDGEGFSMEFPRFNGHTEELG